MNYELKSIRTWSVVKAVFFLSLITGFAVGVLYALFIGPIILLGESFGANPAAENIGVGVILVIMPFFMAFISAVINTILVAIGVPLYNLLGRTIGGIEFSLEAKDTPITPIPAPPQELSKPLIVSPPPPPPVSTSEIEPEESTVLPDESQPSPGESPAPNSETTPESSDNDNDDARQDDKPTQL
ncbi:MAG TPA: hypothetical protein PLF13_12145 [candidate division Zixibacteria bacterium]|nr:hypothetical protein [candidate division Zixibacteria bacterium]